jgi:hypothetical protein
MKDPIDILAVKKAERKALDSEIETITGEARAKLVHNLRYP